MFWNKSNDDIAKVKEEQLYSYVIAKDTLAGFNAGALSSKNNIGKVFVNVEKIENNYVTINNIKDYTFDLNETYEENQNYKVYANKYFYYYKLIK